MERSLPVLPTLEPARTCVWVDAGVLNFKLCNRGFACESCPLDAAIRGDPRPVPVQSGAGPGSAEVAWAFPPDRLYSAAHVWVQVVRAGRVRTGLDACAARLLPPIEGVRPLARGVEVCPGEAICMLDVDGGALFVPSPVAGTVCDWNAQLASTPAQLSLDPYASGWIAEIALAGNAELDGLSRADAAREQARLDARRFGRQAAFGLLAPACLEGCWTDRALLDATRRALGNGCYLSIIQGVLR